MPFAVGSVTWSANGGSISDEGLYQADADCSGGLFTAKAVVDGREAIAEIRVIIASKTGGEGGPGLEPTRKAIRWHGEVPPQKWMNFYTKVLSRFASSPGLKLQVTFEVPAEGDPGQAKADEARSGLKELGLSDEVHFGS